jgi:HD superfamily phosphohydrolase
VDRCDYLLRDAHATGVRYGEYDLPWLLRSLCFVQSPADPGGGAEPASAGQRGLSPPTLGIDGKKGVSALESFVLARYFMFQQVYFHKSGRAAERMVKCILSRALHLVRDGIPLPSMPPALESVAAGDQPSLEDYLELDDQALLVAIHAWERSSDAILADLCRRLRRRDLWKSVELHDTDDASRAEALAKARDIAQAAGLDPNVYVDLDVATDTPYEEDGSLLVGFPRGRPRRPGEVSVVLERLRGATSARTRILFAPELREPMREALIR